MPPVPTRRRPRSPATPTRRIRLLVTITNSDPNDVTVPADGHDPGRRHVGHVPGRHDQQPCRRGHPDGDADGQRHGPGVSGSDTLTVTDTNVPTLTVVLNSHTVNETDPNPATYGTVTRNTPTTTRTDGFASEQRHQQADGPGDRDDPGGSRPRPRSRSRWSTTVRSTATRRRRSRPPPAVSRPVPTAPWWSTTTFRRSP